jgi:beta-carotene hydroxylase
MALLFSVPAHYCFFTVMHEAAHGSISRNGYFNRLFGFLSATAFLAPFNAFQYIHLKHHRHVNDKSLDPDIWSATRPLLLCWLTQDTYYYLVVLRDRGGFDRSFFLEAVAYVVVNAGVMIAFSLSPYALWFWVCWVLSFKLAVSFLAFSFNYLPHIPHDPALQDSKYKKTLVRSSKLLDIPMVGQNFHNIHHLYPKVPFYRYRKIYELGRDFYIQQGTHEIKKPFQHY